MSKPLLGLVMIVKNSGEVIDKVLESVNGVVDYWCILDTGSTDGTPERIRERLSGTPGELHSETFTDFSSMRNRVLNLLGKKTEWALMLDDSYELRDGKSLRTFLERCKKNAVSLPIFTENDEKVYSSIRVTRTNASLRYKYRVHELIDTNDYVSVPEKVCIFDWKPAEHLVRTTKRYERDYQLLLHDYKENPQDSRVSMYLAKTCRALNRKEEAEKWLYKTAELDKVGGDHKYEVNLGIMEILRDTHGVSSDKYLEFAKKHAYEYSMYPDAVFELARCYYLKHLYPDAYKVLKTVIEIKTPETVVILDRRVQRLSAPTLYLDCCFRIGRIEEGIEKLKECLKSYPDEQVFKSIRNAVMKPPYEPIAKFGKKTIVFATKCSTGTWNIDSPKTRIETEVVNMAYQFVQKDYRVFVFSNFLEVKDYEGIECYDLQKFDDWVRTHWVDFLVAVRHTEYLSYYDNIDKVYLWADTLPESDLFHTHSSKFKGIITTGKWMANELSHWYGIPPEMFFYSGECINVDRYKTLREKKEKSFVYFTTPDKSLERVVEVFPKILKKYPEATLTIFASPESIGEKTLSEIRKISRISVESRVLSEKFSERLKEFDVWLYPTDRKDAWCIPAVECMAAGVLCATSSVGCLKDLVGDKGVSHGDDKGGMDELLKKLFFVLDRPVVLSALRKKAREWALRRSYVETSEAWLEFFRK